MVRIPPVICVFSQRLITGYITDSIALGSAKRIMSNRENLYNKILTARLSLPNKCLGPAGDQLVPAAPSDKASFPLPADEHFFVTLRNRQSNLFGWVTVVSTPFTVDAVMLADHAAIRANYSDEYGLELPGREWYLGYLEAVNKQKEGTPMACGWIQVKLPGARNRSLRVHKVFFYDK